MIKYYTRLIVMSPVVHILHTRWQPFCFDPPIMHHKVECCIVGVLHYGNECCIMGVSDALWVVVPGKSARGQGVEQPSWLSGVS